MNIFYPSILQLSLLPVSYTHLDVYKRQSNHHLVILLILLYASIIASSLLENRIDNAHRIPLCILPIQIHLQQPL